jgi:hypothetical protein
MTSRSAFLILTALLLVASLAGAQTLATPTGGTPAFMASAEPSPDCAKTELSFLNPDPVQKSGALCGSCSQTICQGSTTGTLCAFKNGRYYYCQAVLGNSCSTGGLECSCWTGPLP